jgi:hypothetical protein
MNNITSVGARGKGPATARGQRVNGRAAVIAVRPACGMAR